MTATKPRVSQLFTWRSAVIDDPALTASARHVALTLSLHMSERGDNAFPSVETLARECARGKSTIVESLKALEACGWLAVDRAPGAAGGRGRVNRYSATLPQSVLRSSVSANGPDAETVLSDEETVLTPSETVLRAAVEHVLTTSEDVKPPRPQADAPVEDDYFDADKWRHLLDKLHRIGWTETGAGAVTWRFLMRLRSIYGSAVVDSSLSQATLENTAPVLSSAAYLQGICERVRDEMAAA